MALAASGSWKSPITAEMLVDEAVSLSQVTVDGADVYWIEARPSESGRHVVVRWSQGHPPIDILPPGFSARTIVHEYGGGAFAVRSGVVWFSHFDDQRVYRLEAGEKPWPITKEPPTPRSVRFADFDVSPDGSLLACVRERHLDNGTVVNDLVLLDAIGAASPRVFAEGQDFYSAPRFSRDGRLAWLSWDHPNMPWDGTTLWVDHERVAGGRDESITQPRWGPDGSLYWASDRSGWWNLYRDGTALWPDDAEFSGPDWAFGQSTYAVFADGMVVAASTKDGRGRMCILEPTGEVAQRTDFTAFASVQAHGERAVVAVAASARESSAVVCIDLAEGGVDVLRRSRPGSVDAGYLSVPEPITFPTDGGVDAHALFYPPANRDFEAPAGELHRWW